MVEDYINDDGPYLPLSCELAWQKSGQNDNEYINIINCLVAITYISHDFDVALVNKAPEADQVRLRKTFYVEVGKRCMARPQRLLAGVVDRSLVYAFDKDASEADHDPDQVQNIQKRRQLTAVFNPLPHQINADRALRKGRLP